MCTILRTTIYALIVLSMSDAGDEIKVDAVETVEVAAEAPKGKLSVEDALQVLMSHRDLNTELNTE